MIGLETETQSHNCGNILALQIDRRELVQIVCLQFVTAQLHTCAICIPASVFAFDTCGTRTIRARVIIYKVYMRINLYDNDIKIPGQEIFGEIGGFLRSDDDSRCWIITSSEVNEKKHTAKRQHGKQYKQYQPEHISASFI